MSQFEAIEIERDLVRWTRSRWLLILLLIIAIQAGLLLRPERLKPVRSPVSRPPRIAFARESGLAPEVIDLEDPTLFASPNLHGFSGPAWMIQGAWVAPAERGLPKPVFVSLQKSTWRRQSETELVTPPFKPTPPESEPSTLVIPDSGWSEKSRLFWEPLQARKLLNAPPLANQFATDILRASVVEVLIDAEGAVFSARLLNSSGSKSVDADALSIARKATFEPLRREPAQPAENITTGKLTFDWYALDPSQTNAVKR